nr:hypothetical protein [Massilia sp. 9096]
MLAQTLTQESSQEFFRFSNKDLPIFPNHEPGVCKYFRHQGRPVQLRAEDMNFYLAYDLFRLAGIMQAS